MPELSGIQVITVLDFIYCDVDLYIPRSENTFIP